MSGPDDNESPGVPGFRTWRGVYLFVLAVFAVVVAALTIFTHAFS
jgi:hypothetical protein